MFRDRNDAADQLSEPLQRWRSQHPLVLAIPRGAVPMAQRIAQRLGTDWDVVLVRKLRAPWQPELAIGSIDESGWVYQSPEAASCGADAAYLEQEQREQLATLHRRRAQYTPLRAPIDPAGRVVIVVDDGLATGATMIAALHSLRLRHPARLICAVPVAPADTLAQVRALADDVVCLLTPASFQGVGQFYEQFAQIEDDEVIACLRSGSPLENHLRR